MADPVHRALTEAHEQEDPSMSDLSEAVATSDANAKPGSGLIVPPGSSLIVHLGLSSGVGLDFSLGVNPTTVPLAAPLIKPPTASAPESIQHPPETFAPAISVAALSTQTSAATLSVAMPPANNATVSVPSDDDSDDCDIVAVIRKEAGKQARLKNVPGHAVSRPDLGTMPLAFRSATAMDIKTLTNIFGFRKSKESLTLGASLKRPLVIDDRSDEEETTTTNARPKKVKTGESLRKSSHRKEGKRSKSRHKSSGKSSKHHRTSRPQEVSPRTSPGMPWEAGQTGETLPTTIPGTVSPQSTTESNERAWAAAQKSAAPPAATRPTPISTIIAPTPHTRSALTRAAPLRPAPTRLIPSATIAPVTPNAQDKAEEFRRKRREDTKRKEEEIAARKQAKELEKQKEVPKNDPALFQSFAAKVPQVTKTRIVNNLPANNFQRPEVRKRTTARKPTVQPSINIFRTAPKATSLRPAGHTRHPIAPPPPRYPGHPDNDDDDDYDDNEPQTALTGHAVYPTTRTRQPAATNAYNQYPGNNLSYHTPAPRAPRRPIETLDALDALGEDRSVIQYVVWRTTPFIPQGVETREHHKVRCLSYVDPQTANAGAQAWYDRPKKGIAGKSFQFVGGARKLFDGVVKFEGGKLQYSWVEEEVQSLGEVVRARGGLMLDRERVGVVVRKRFDVVSVHVVWKEQEQEEEEEGEGENGGEKMAAEEKTEEVSKRKGMQSRVLVIDCGGEEEDGAAREDTVMGDDENEHGEEGAHEGEFCVATNTAVRTTTNTQTSSHRSLQDALDTPVKFHGTFTTMTDAQNAALKAFLALAKPDAAQPDEDKHWFKYYVAPEMEESVKEQIEKNPNGEFLIEWEPPKENKWNFFRLIVRVVESKLTGPIDISDMVVEAPEGVPRGGTAAAPAAQKPQAAKEKPTPQTGQVAPVPVTLRPSTPPPPSPQRMLVAVAPATAPEKPASIPSTTASAVDAVASPGVPASNLSTMKLSPAQVPVTQREVPLPLRPVAPVAAVTSLATETRTPFVMTGDDESEVSEEE